MSMSSNGKKVDILEYWKTRFEQELQKGMTLEDLQDIYVDLMMSNLSGNDDVTQVPCVVLQIPLYSRDNDGKIVPLNIEEEEEVLDKFQSMGEVDGWMIDGVIQSVTYIENET